MERRPDRERSLGILRALKREAFEVDGMTRVACVGGRPAPSRAFGKELFPVRTVLAPNGPRGHVVRVVTGVPFVVERELFDRAVPGVEVVQFVVKLPLAATPSTGDGRDTGVLGSGRVVSHGFTLRATYLNAGHEFGLRLRIRVGCESSRTDVTALASSVGV